MKEFVITHVEAGRRLDRYVLKQFPDMPRSCLYRMLRQNGFRLNGVRVHDGSRVLEEGDLLSVYLTDEQVCAWQRTTTSAFPSSDVLSVLYENEDLVAFDKPAGMLSQKDREGEASLSELGTAYLYTHGLEPSKGFVPGVLNRLDRMTSGVVVMGRNLRAQQALSQMIREDMIDKDYLAILCGRPEWDSRHLVHSAKKDDRLNRLVVSEAGEKGFFIESEIFLLRRSSVDDLSLVRVRLHTGKSHQIRAQLAFEGYPILGDAKYHGRTRLPDQTVVRRQMLVAKTLTFRKTCPPLTYLTGLEISAEVPQDMQKILDLYF